MKLTWSLSIANFTTHHQSCKHVADVGLQESLNNILERMHGSIREREKVMRVIKVDDTPIIPMDQIYYNFIGHIRDLKAKHQQERQEFGLAEWTSGSDY